MMLAERPLLLGHRGDRCTAPENTIAAFDLALINGCDGFEFDVRLTSDAQAIICHDPDFLGMPVAATNFNVLLNQYLNKAAVNSLRDDQKLQPRDHIPRLEDVFQRYASTAFLDIELKVPGLEAAVLAGLKKSPPAHGHVVSSFLPDVLRKIRRLDREVPLGFICDDLKLLPLWHELPAEYVIPKYDLISPQLVSAIHETRRKVFVWTVNEESIMNYFAKLTVDGIISDDSRLLAQTLKERQFT